MSAVRCYWTDHKHKNVPRVQIDRMRNCKLRCETEKQTCSLTVQRVQAFDKISLNTNILSSVVMYVFACIFRVSNGVWTRCYVAHGCNKQRYWSIPPTSRRDVMCPMVAISNATGLSHQSVDVTLCVQWLQ